MKYELYVIYDRVAGVYGDPFVCINAGMAMRFVRESLVDPRMSAIRGDLDLIKVGLFDKKTGMVDPDQEFVIHLSDVPLDAPSVSVLESGYEGVNEDDRDS